MRVRTRVGRSGGTGLLVCVIACCASDLLLWRRLLTDDLLYSGDSGDTFSASIKVDSVFKLDFTCQLCGAECSFEVPVIKQKVHTGVPNFITAFLLALETQRDLKGEAGRGEPL